MKNNKEHHKNKKTVIITEKRNSSLLLIIIAFCIPVLLYLQTIKFGFTDFDDNIIISNNISTLSNIGNAPKVFLTDAFTSKSMSLYRPLQTLSYMLDLQLSGKDNTWMFHLSNILLLGLIACALFLLLKKFLIPPMLALLGTLLYCVHPLFVSTIAWIPARGDLLMTLFSLLSFLFFIEFLKKGKNIYLFLNWVTFSIALFCEETAALLPFLFIIYYFIFSTKKRFEKKYLFYILLYAVLVILWFWLRTKAIGGFSNKNDMVGLMPILYNLQTIPESLTKFFLPYDFAPIPDFSIIKTLVGFGLIVAIIVIVFKNKERTKKEKIFCLLWFFILMLPPMLYKNKLIEYLDHRFFLPLIGILLFLLLIFPRKWYEKVNIKTYWIIVVAIVILSSFTFIKSHPYSNPMSFYNYAISKNSNSALAYCSRGNLKSDKKDFNGALDDYNKAIACDPTFYKAYFNRGSIKLNNLGDNAGAKADFNTVISLNTKNANAYYYRGEANYNLGNLKDAIEDYNLTVSFDPNNYKAYYNSGCIKNREGNYQEAILDFDKAIVILPAYSEAYNNKGVSNYSLHNFKEALINFSKAIEINPNYIDAYYNRSVTKYNLKDIRGAIEDCEIILRLNPNFKKALYFKIKIQKELH